jgi:hypothetical protein
MRGAGFLAGLFLAIDAPLQFRPESGVAEGAVRVSHNPPVLLIE